MGAGAETVAPDLYSAARHEGVGIPVVSRALLAAVMGPRIRQRRVCHGTHVDWRHATVTIAFVFPPFFLGGGQRSAVDPFEAGLVGVN